jgi:hypothetical protein
VEAAGIAIGTTASVLFARLIGSLLFGGGATDDVSYVVAALAMAGTALLGSYLLVWRLLQCDPAGASGSRLSRGSRGRSLQQRARGRRRRESGGRDQTSKYMDALPDTMKGLVRGTVFTRPRDDLTPAIQMARSGSHSIFFEVDQSRTGF